MAEAARVIVRSLGWIGQILYIVLAEAGYRFEREKKCISICQKMHIELSEAACVLL